MIDGAGPTSREELLKYWKERKVPLAQGISTFPSTPLHQNCCSSHSAHSLRLGERGRSYWWSRRADSLFSDLEELQCFLDSKEGCRRMCQTIDKARVFYWEGLSVNILMALGSSFCKSSKKSSLIYMQEYLGGYIGRWTESVGGGEKRVPRRKKKPRAARRKSKGEAGGRRVPCLRC